MKTSIVLNLMLLAVAPVFAQPAVVEYEGIASNPEHGGVLYKEQHLVRGSGPLPSERLVIYRCPDGRPFARKTVQYGEPAYSPQFRMDDARFGYAEGFRHDGGDGQPFVQRQGDREETDRVPLAENLVVDAGFDEFVRARWQDLQSGQTVPIEFLVPSRLTAYGFKLKKLRSDTIEGAAVSVFRLALTGVLGWFADAIDVSYRDSDRRLMRFEGLSNIKGRDQDNLIARIDFPLSAAERAVDAAAWTAALAEPLVRCQVGE